MEKQNLNNSLRETVDEMKGYLDLQIKYQKMQAAKKTGKLSSFSALFLILFAIATSFTLFFSFAFVWWYSDGITSKMYEGYLIIAGFYAVLAIITIIFRKQLLFNPILKLLTDIFFEDDSDKDGDETIEKVNLKDEESFNKILIEEKEKIKEKEELIQVKFKEIEKEFTFINLVKMAAGSMMNTYITTATVAKLAFKTISNLKRKKKKQIKK
jgi:uncharacterized membrane protein YgcG